MRVGQTCFCLGNMVATGTHYADSTEERRAGREWMGDAVWLCRCPACSPAGERPSAPGSPYELRALGEKLFLFWAFPGGRCDEAFSPSEARPLGGGVSLGHLASREVTPHMGALSQVSISRGRDYTSGLQPVGDHRGARSKG